MAVTVTTYPNEAATSYVSVADFEAYCDQRLYDYSAKSDDEKAVAVNSATLYMDTRFQFIGYRKESTQEREWPRESAWDNRGDRVTGVPKAVVDACCEYAWKALNGTDLMPDPTRDTTGKVVVSESSKVGPISENKQYAEGVGYELPQFPAADRLLYRMGLVNKRGGIGFGQVGRA